MKVLSIIKLKYYSNSEILYILSSKARFKAIENEISGNTLDFSEKGHHLYKKIGFYSDVFIKI